MLFTKSMEVTKLHCIRHRQVYILCSKVYEYFDNHSEFSKKDPSVPRQSCSDEIARNCLMWLCTSLES